MSMGGQRADEVCRQSCGPCVVDSIRTEARLENLQGVVRPVRGQQLQNRHGLKNGVGSRTTRTWSTVSEQRHGWQNMKGVVRPVRGQQHQNRHGQQLRGQQLQNRRFCRESYDPYVVNSIGNCEASLGRWQEARDAYTLAAQLFQGSKGLRGRGGSTTQRVDGAIFAQSNAALALAQLGDLPGAAKELEYVARRGPGLSLIHI